MRKLILFLTMFTVSFVASATSFTVRNDSSDGADVEFAQGPDLNCADLNEATDVHIDAGRSQQFYCVDENRVCYRYKKTAMDTWSDWYSGDCSNLINEGIFN